MAEKKKKGDRYQPPDIKNEDERKKALNDTLAKIEKDFGKGAVMRLGDTHVDNIPVLPTGSLSLDIALGVGGIPCGRIAELFGPESSGKTTVALHIVAEVQKLGGIAGYIDAEHALDPIYAKKLGVNIDELYISQPDDGEQALEIAEAMVRSGVIDIVVVDSVAALTPRAEIAGDMSDSQVGILARLMSKALRKLTAVANKTNCTILFINQLRDKIGGMVGYGGPSETTTGGRALKFYASVRLDIRRIGQVKLGEAQIGSRTKVKVAKNKVAPPFKTCEFDIMFGEGISKSGDLLDMAEVLGIVKKGGAWYSYGDLRLGQGRENSKTYISENLEVADEIEAKLREHYNVPKVSNLALSKETEPVEDEKPKSKSKGKKSAKAAQEEESFEYDDADPGDIPGEILNEGDELEDDDLLVDDLQFEE